MLDTRTKFYSIKYMEYTLSFTIFIVKLEYNDFRISITIKIVNYAFILFVNDYAHLFVYQNI